MNFLEKLYDNYSIFPAKPDKSPAVKSWKPFREKKISYDLLSGHTFFGLVCGFEQLEVIDIDNHFDDASQLFSYISDNYDLSEFPIIKTGGGGYHIYYKCDEIEGNKKLAQRINSKGKAETLVETRGAGGYVICPPSKGYEVISGDIFKCPTISIDERIELLEICKSLNEVDKKEEIPPNTGTPGDTYNNDLSSINETIGLLKQNGWTSENNHHFRRPGKKTGFSATFGKVGKNKFYVFSTNADPFKSDESYSMFGVRATLLHNGNYSECAKELAKKYNIQTPAKAKKKPKSDDKVSAAMVKWLVLREIIEDWHLKFRFNELTKVVEFSQNNGKYEMLGLLLGDIIYEMEMNRGVKSISSAKLEEMIRSNNICDIYNPIKEFFAKLPAWDGVDYFEKLNQYITLDIDEKPLFFTSMLKKHIIRAIRCATQNEVNRMVLTFHGPQEVGKTRFFQWLVPDEIYSQEMIDPSDKDSILSLSRYLILNMDDIDSLNKKEVSKLKGFISKGSITKRVAYGRSDEKFNRVATFVASTNKSDILADDSNTRWIILKVKSFNWREYKKEINPLQIWAQAYAELKKDVESGELTKEERNEREHRNNVQFLETSVERELIVKYFDEGDIAMTSTDILVILQQLNYGIKLNQYQLVRELKRLFGEPINKRVNGKAGRYYDVMPPKQDKNKSFDGFYNETEPRQIEGDAPF